MSVDSGWFTNDDGEVFKMSSVVAVEASQGSNGGTQYEVVLINGHTSIKESHYSRAALITALKLT